jgi:hypothetical protein
MIAAEDRRRMLAVDLCGRRVLARLEQIGIRRLSDLKARDPWELMHRVNADVGAPIWQPPMAIRALTNLVEAADAEPANRVAEHHGTAPATR